jgi:hypothetical protein
MFTIDQDTKTMTIIKKDTASFDIELDNYMFTIGDEVIFTVNTDVELEEPILQKIVTDFEDGIATVHLTTEDTNIDIGTYKYDVQVNAQDGRVDTVIGPAKFIVKGGVTF